MGFVTKARSGVRRRRRIWGQELENVAGRVRVGWGTGVILSQPTEAGPGSVLSVLV